IILHFSDLERYRRIWLNSPQYQTLTLFIQILPFFCEFFVSLTSFWILRLGKMQIKFAFALGLFVSLPWKIFVWAASCSA
ncbi:hypothetical protein, partial [Alistipes putredinis]|uniref:hypothetical protein n=1 Tax=Alistipes putredinis TaxID=28117 RepID=UPI003AB84ACB